MPPLPSTPDRNRSPPGPGKPGYIQPATPLTYSNLNPAKGRAVTDPVSSKNLFSAGKGSVNDLRNKFSGSRTQTSTENAASKHTCYVFCPFFETLPAILRPHVSVKFCPTLPCPAAMPDYHFWVRLLASEFSEALVFNHLLTTYNVSASLV